VTDHCQRISGLMVGTYGQRDLLSESMNVQDARVSRADDVFRLDDTEIRFERRDRFNGLGNGGQNVARGDIFVGNATNSKSDIVATEGLIQFLRLFCKYTGNFDGAL